MPTEVFDDPQAFLAALQGKKRKPAKESRPGIPRAEPGEGDRIAQLMRIARFGYGPRWTAGVFYFWNPRTDATTTKHATYAAACIAAEKELSK
jgi:hypothetical protein